MTRRAPIVTLEVGVSLRLDLRSIAQGATPPSGFEVRELERGEMARVLGGSPALARPAERVDAVAPAGWRCFVAFEGSTPVHISFVELRAGRPLMFGGVTVPTARGRGAFRATVHYVAARLREAGDTMLYTSVGWRNRASLRACSAAGFEIVRRRVDLYVLGTSLRGVARRLVSRVFG